MAKLPTEIITDILSRLPVKSLLRFRSVSKPWCSLIDARDFIKTHHHKSLENNNLTLILGGMGNPESTLHSLDFNSLDQPIPFDNQFKNYEVLGSCNGLLLLQGAHNIALFNPSTRNYKILPSAPIEYPKSNVSSFFEKYGFGYDSVKDDCKVIRVVQFTQFLNWVKSEAWVYGLKSNLWRKVEDFPYFLPYKRVWGAHVKGALHTVVSKSDDIDSPKVISAFDIRAEKYYLVPQPDLPDKEDIDMTVEVLGGCLCMMGSYPRYKTDIWVMKDYGVKKSWTKLLSISPPMVKPYVSLYPLGYSKSGNEVLLNFDDKKLIWYDLKRRTIRNAKVRGLPKLFYVEVCVGSLFPLHGYGESGDYKEQHQHEKNKPKNIKKRDDFLSKGFKLVL